MSVAKCEEGLIDRLRGRIWNEVNGNITLVTGRSDEARCTYYPAWYRCLALDAFWPNVDLKGCGAGGHGEGCTVNRDRDTLLALRRRLRRRVRTIRPLNDFTRAASPALFRSAPLISSIEGQWHVISYGLLVGTMERI